MRIPTGPAVLRTAVHTLCFAGLTLAYLFSSHAPLRVHTFSVLCFAAAYWAPCCVASDLAGLRTRVAWWGSLIVIGMLTWDSSLRSGSEAKWRRETYCV